MWQAMLFGLLAGVMGGNAIPHFVRGITKEPYPTVFGSSPVTNLVVGWTGLVLTALLALLARAGQRPVWALCSGVVGVLLIGLFHAGPGAFGREA
jgi:hypothetical protein